MCCRLSAEAMRKLQSVGLGIEEAQSATSLSRELEKLGISVR